MMSDTFYIIKKEIELSELPPTEKEKVRETIEKFGKDLSNFCGYLTENVLFIPNKILYIFPGESEDEIKNSFDKIFSKFMNYIISELAKEEIIYELSLLNFPVNESSLANSKILKLLVLLNKKAELIEALYFILSQPHRKLVEYEEYKDFYEVSIIDANVLADIVSNPKFLYKTTNGVIFNQYSPVKVLQYQSDETYDTLENRFVKHFLKELLYVLSEEFLFLEPLKELKEEIEFILNSSIFEEVGELNVFPSTSQVLMKRTGYREVYNIYRLLHLAYVPTIFSNLDMAFSLRDMATLWEYYVLLQLLRELKKNYGNYKIEVNFVPKSVNKTIYYYAKFKFGKELVLYYQKNLPAYSGIEFRPDFLIEKDNKNYVFDAKFRIFENNKRDILENMHYYKDGLSLEFAIAISLASSLKDDGKGKFFHKIKKSNNNEIEFKEFFAKFTTDFNGVGYFMLSLDKVIKQIIQ